MAESETGTGKEAPEGTESDATKTAPTEGRAEPAEAKPAEEKPIETKPVDKPIEAKPAEEKHAESKPDASAPPTKPAEAKPSRPSEPQPVEQTLPASKSGDSARLTALLTFGGGVLVSALGAFIVWKVFDPIGRRDHAAKTEENPYTACLRTVLKSHTSEQRERLVDAATAFYEGKLNAQSKESKSEFYRELDSASQRVALSGCEVVYGSKRRQSLDVTLNVRVKGKPTSRVKGGRIIRLDRQDQSCEIDRQGKCTLKLDGLETLEQDRVKFTIELEDGIPRDYDRSVSELVQAAPLEIDDPEITELGLTFQDCKGKPLSIPGTVMIDTPSDSIWGKTCGRIQDRDEEARLTERLASSRASFRYARGQLGTFAITLRLDSGEQETYSDQSEPKGINLAPLRFPKDCSAPHTAMVAARQACPDLEQRIAQTLGRAGGTRRTTSTVDPGPGGVKCSDASVCREISAFNAELVSRSCAAFSVTANVD